MELGLGLVLGSYLKIVALCEIKVKTFKAYLNCFIWNWFLLLSFKWCFKIVEVQYQSLLFYVTWDHRYCQCYCKTVITFWGVIFSPSVSAGFWRGRIAMLWKKLFFLVVAMLVFWSRLKTGHIILMNMVSDLYFADKTWFLLALLPFLTLYSF